MGEGMERERGWGHFALGKRRQIHVDGEDGKRDNLVWEERGSEGQICVRRG